MTGREFSPHDVRSALAKIKMGFQLLGTLEAQAELTPEERAVALKAAQESLALVTDYVTQALKTKSA